MANGFWGIQGPVLPTLVQSLADKTSVGTTYGFINGIGNLVSAFVPAVMGALIAGHTKDNFEAGFTLLIGAQVIIIFSGIRLLFLKQARWPGKGAVLRDIEG